MLVGSCVGFLLIASISHDGLRALNQYEQQPVRERSNKQQRRMNQNQQPIKESEDRDQDDEAATEAETEESKEQQPTSDDEETQTEKVRLQAIFISLVFFHDLLRPCAFSAKRFCSTSR